jgi:hypothetical protein
VFNSKLLATKLELMVFLCPTLSLLPMESTVLEAPVAIFLFVLLTIMLLTNCTVVLEFLLSVEMVTEVESEVALVE